ncbi:putative Pex19 protein family [Trypanosoma vivax]|uniref:Peroxin 19 n=1 Tax=Trypanosoma vivax (strain Y486) TaxID=1055687 RepID=G0U3A6_TRYVY|nr:putative Pex19 protein family [Trypanosoma vivax]CCC50762.1 conserved hypothetical protein [Trypanosoma vivax Y486]
MSNSDNGDDLDALLDDCLNTMDKQERQHEEEVQARQAARHLEQQQQAVGTGQQDVELLRVIQSLISECGEDGGADMDTLAESLRTELSKIQQLMEHMPDVTNEERESLTQIQQLVSSLKERGGPSEGPAYSAVAGEQVPQPSEKEISPEEIEGLCELLGKMQQFDTLNDESLQTKPGEDGNVELPQALSNALLNLLLDNQLLSSLHRVRECYPRWLAANQDKVSTEDLARYQKQHQLAISICDFLDHNVVDSPDEQKMHQLLTLMHEYSCLAPLPPGLSDFQDDKTI